MRLLLPPLFAGGFLVVLAMLAFQIWMLVDAIRRPESEFNPPASRVWWIVGLAVGLVVNALGLVVAILYFVLVRRPLSRGEPPAALFKGSGGGAQTTGRVCPNCGHPLGTHARFCQNCGTAIQEEMND